MCKRFNFNAKYLCLCLCFGRFGTQQPTNLFNNKPATTGFGAQPATGFGQPAATGFSGFGAPATSQPISMFNGGSFGTNTFPFGQTTTAASTGFGTIGAGSEFISLFL